MLRNGAQNSKLYRFFSIYLHIYLLGALANQARGLLPFSSYPSLPSIYCHSISGFRGKKWGKWTIMNSSFFSALNADALLCSHASHGTPFYKISASWDKFSPACPITCPRHWVARRRSIWAPFILSTRREVRIRSNRFPFLFAIRLNSNIVSWFHSLYNSWLPRYFVAFLLS
jgi:hypothetical protein